MNICKGVTALFFCVCVCPAPRFCFCKTTELIFNCPSYFHFFFFSRALILVVHRVVECNRLVREDYSSLTHFAFSLELLFTSGNNFIYLFIHFLSVCFFVFFCFCFFLFYFGGGGFLCACVCSLACLSVAFSVVVTTFFYSVGKRVV